MDVQVGDQVRLRKPHPCGSYDWRVVRIGADIGLKCQTCGRRVLLDRATFRKRVKRIERASIQPGAEQTPEPSSHGEDGL